MGAAGLEQLWPGDREPRRRQLPPQGPFRAAAGRPASGRQRWLAWSLAMAVLAGAWLGVGCSTSWLANNGTARGVALPPAMDSARLLSNAHYYQLMGRPEIALKELQQAHEVDPADLKVVEALARMYQEQGQFQPVSGAVPGDPETLWRKPGLAQQLVLLLLSSGRLRQGRILPPGGPGL